MYLILISMFDFGSSFIYDIPQSLAPVFKHRLGIESHQTMLLYSAYSFPNLFINLLGGLLTIKFGYKRCLQIYTCFVTAGQLIFCLGCSGNWYSLMVLGRVVQGCGAENLMITQYYSSHQTFEGSFIITAIGINQCFSYMANFFSYFSVPYVYMKTKSVSFTVYYSALAPLLSLICVFLFVYLKTAEERESKPNPNKSYNFQQSATDSESDELNPSVECSGLSLAIPEALKEDTGQEQKSNEELFDFRQFKWEDLKRFPTIFWYICLLPLTVGCAYFQFTNICTSLIKHKYHLSYSDSKNIPMLFPLTLMILLPLLSNSAQKYGRRGLYFVASTLVAIIAYILLLVSDEDDQWTKVPLMLLMGLFFALYSSVFWAAITEVLEPSLVNIGLAIANTFQNFSNFIYPILLSGLLRRITVESINMFLMLMTLILALGFLVTIKINHIDFYGSQLLIKPVKQE